MKAKLCRSVIILSASIMTTITLASGHQIPKCSGLYLGLGGTFSTIDEDFKSFMHTNTDKSSFDLYESHQNRLTPLIQVGYWSPTCTKWLWGMELKWQDLGYKTSNEESNRGQHLENATFSSINFFGPEVDRDFSSITKMNNQITFLGYVGESVWKGFAYVGIGPALLNASNTIYVSSVHIPNGIGDHLISTSVRDNKTAWGGTIEVGYNYYLSSTWFLNVSYMYSQMNKTKFKNLANTAILNGFDAPGATTLGVDRSLDFRQQAICLSFNKVF